MSDTKVKRTRGRPFSLDRDEVLCRAMNVFRAQGFDGASVPVLTEVTGISAQSLYAAFGFKDRLYRETIELYLRTRGSFVARAIEEEQDVLKTTSRILSGRPGCTSTCQPRVA